MNIEPYMEMFQVITGDYEKRMGKDPVDLAEQEHDRKTWDVEKEEPDPDEARDREISDQLGRDRKAVLDILAVMIEEDSASTAVDALVMLIDDARRGMG